MLGGCLNGAALRDKSRVSNEGEGISNDGLRGKGAKARDQ